MRIWKTLAIAALLGLPASAQDVVSHQQARCNNQRLLNQVAWHKDLDEALALARQQNKPVLWVHLLGDLEGST